MFKIYLVQRQEKTKVLQTSSSCLLLEVKKESGFIICVRNAIALIMLESFSKKEINCLELCLV